MKNEIKVPSLGESISEVTIGQILSPTGTVVNIDAEILELETDKVNQILYAPIAGLVHLTVQTGEVVKIGQTIGVIDPQEATLIQPTIQQPAIQKSDKQSEEGFKSASSLEDGAIRYTKEEFLEELKAPVQELPNRKEKSKESLIPLKEKEEKRESRKPLSRIRKVIAEKMVEAHQTTAMLTTFNEVNLTQVILLRERYKEEFMKKYGCRLGWMSFFIKAAVSALQAFPDLNSYLDEGEVVHRHYYDIGVAVGTDKGVLVPVIRDCDQLTFAELEQAIENYAKKAKEGSLVLADLKGAGFTITNGGVYGSLLSTPILVPPQCGILGMHKIEKRPVVVEDVVVIRSMMYMALSYDHRLIDGKEAVSFLVHLKEKLEDPARLLLNI